MSYGSYGAPEPPVVALARRGDAPSAAAARQRRVTTIVTIVCVALVAASVVFLWRHYANTRAAAANAAANSTQITPPHLTNDASAITSSAADPKPGAVTVDVHMDYQCPACKIYEDYFGGAFDQLIANGDIIVNYHIRSFLDTALSNDSSLRAGIAAACADTVGAFQAYHDTIYANQPETEGDGYTDDQLRAAFATQAGIAGNDLTTFQTCYDSRRTADVVAQMEPLNAQNPAVTGTPTFLIDGAPVDLTTTAADSAALLATLKAAAGIG